MALHTARSTLAAVFLAGLVVGVLLPGVLSPQGVTVIPPDPDDPSPAYSLSHGGPACLSATSPNAGWLVATTAVSARGFTLNATLTHERGRTVESAVSRVAPGDYVIRFRAVPVEAGRTERKSVRNETCPVGTEVQLSTGLPMAYDSLQIVYGERTVLTAHNSGETVARFWPIENPMNATV